MKTIKLHEIPEVAGKHAIGFSGTRFLTSVSRRKARDLFFDNVPWYQTFDCSVHGAAKGIDTVTGEFAIEFELPFATRLVIVPGDTKKVDWSFENWATHVFYCPKGSTYKDRNQMLCLASNSLSAFPDYAEHDKDGQRSGTWQCVRQMRALRRPIRVNILTGGYLWES